MGCYPAMMYTSSKTGGFLGTHKTGLTRFLIFQWKLLSSATYLRVINGTFNHLLGTEITRVILNRNRVGTENRVLWKVGFKLIPKYTVLINEYIQPRQATFESNASKRLKAECYLNDITQPFHSSEAQFFQKNLKLIFVLIIKLTSFLKSLRKSNATLCAILDMKVFNTDIIDTFA